MSWLINYLEAEKELVGKKVHFKTGNQDITLKKVQKIINPADLKKTPEGLLFVAQGEIQCHNVVGGVMVDVYVYPRTEIFIKFTGGIKGQSSGSIICSLPIR